MSTLRFVLFMAAYVALCGSANAQNPAETYKQGHSLHGESFDSGPRQKPWVLAGIGQAHFPITTTNAEVQRWFDQGNALLHSFWYYEAERAFRWCVKLEPGNPMPYWGLARSANGTRAEDFIREAQKRKEHASERERLYIDALAAQLLPDPLREKDSTPNWQERNKQAKKFLETLCVKYPDDMEARALLALDTMGDSRYGAELMIREILAKQPDHPGAHHYRIHNWDYHEPEQALDSSRRYGELVPGIGHALHMPGHIFSIVGMWNEAAISMDAATRAEKQYMKDSLTFPFNTWNYGHNRNYLSYIQEQLGMVNAAMFGARQLIDAPPDPKDNNDGAFTNQSFGIAALARALLKFERWDDLLNPKTIPWRDIYRDKVNKAYFEARAWLGKADIEKAEKSIVAHAALKTDLDKNKDMERLYDVQAIELKARLALARGERITGLGLMADAAQREFDLQRQYADPPQYPQALYSSLGEAYLNANSPGLAIEAFEKALTLTHNDLFALSGLVRAYAQTGEAAKAQDAMARLLFVTADADPGLKMIERAKATGITATARDSSPRPQRNYLRTSLEKYGPNRWEPYDAPQLDVLDSEGKHVSLQDYRGKNVMLIFYLGQECPHCMRQLHDIGNKKDDWERLNTVVLAVSSASSQKNAETLKTLGKLPIRLLSDDHYTNARRFHSYDDFEEIELHSTLLIDSKGRVYWARLGGDPFSDTAFLTKQLERMNDLRGDTV
jgi:peroxiredoxin